MALILAPTQQKRIKVLGTDVELTSLYLRLEFRARMDGITLEINATQFSDKSKYLANTPVVTDIVSPQVMFSIDPETQVQDIAAAHQLLKNYFEENGYAATIDLVV